MRSAGLRLKRPVVSRPSVTVNGSALTVSIDGVTFYSGTDSSHASGTVGFYTWRNSGPTFDNVIVQGVMPMAGIAAPQLTLDERAARFAKSDTTIQLNDSTVRNGDAKSDSSSAPFPLLRSGEESLRKTPAEVGGLGRRPLLSANAGAGSMTRSLQ